MRLINTILQNVIGSFDTHSKAWSGRKLTAFIAVVTSIYITVFNVKADNALYFLQSWQLFSLLCLGIVTAQQIIKLFLETKSYGKSKDVSETGS
jgi:hypothetical protein